MSPHMIRLHVALVEASNALDDVRGSIDKPLRHSQEAELRTVDKAIDDLLRWVQGQMEDARRERVGE